MKTTLVDMTKRVSLFYGWGKLCREKNVWPETAQAALFVDHPPSLGWLPGVKAVSNLYEVDAFWNGYQNG